MEIKEIYTVETIRAGREDDSSDIFISSAPFARRHQWRYSSKNHWTDQMFIPGVYVIIPNWVGNYINYQWQFNDYYFKIGQKVLVETFLCLWNYYIYVATGDPIAAIVDGPWFPSFGYGEIENCLTAGVSIVPTDYWDFLTLFILAHTTETIVTDMDFVINGMVEVIRNE